jgi:hypothetical protein
VAIITARDNAITLECLNVWLAGAVLESSLAGDFRLLIV